MTINGKLTNYPSNIKKDSKIFSALIANSEQNGAIETELNNSKNYLLEWVNIKDVYETTKDKLEKIVSFFSFIEKFTDETDKSLRNRFSAIFRRGKDTKWGSKLNIKHVFEQYFSLSQVFVIDNTNDISENLIQDGEFEKIESGYWIFSNSTYDKKARFSKGLGALINGFIAQSVQVEKNKTYFLHFFYRGKGNVSFKNEKNNYWNDKTKEWQKSESYINFASDKWTDFSTWIRSEDFESESENVEIKIENSDTDLCVDYVRFFKKNPYASFTVLVHFDGKNSCKAMALYGGNEDYPSEIYKNAFYYDNAFLTGTMSGFAMDIYTDLLKYLNAIGVKSYLEIVVKDYIEGDENE